jgi:hypothetical protein
MKTSPEVERWFAEKEPPTEATMRRVREIILGADRRMTEYVKYGNLGFGYDGDFATFVQASEGSHPSARFMRFADPAEAKARAAELNKIVAAWGALPPADRGPAKSKR